jgi:hypothetical protein
MMLKCRHHLNDRGTDLYAPIGSGVIRTQEPKNNMTESDQNSIELFGGEIRVNNYDFNSVLKSNTSINAPKPNLSSSEPKLSSLLDGKSSGGEKKRSKKQHLKPCTNSCAPNHPSEPKSRKRALVPDTLSDLPPYPPIHEFAGIETFCRNASSQKALTALLSKCTSSSYLSLALLWFDGSSTHAPTSVKLCTPTRNCSAWNCTCDRNIRINQCFVPLRGALIGISGEEHCYFLPLDASESDAGTRQPLFHPTGVLRFLL